MTIFLLNFMGLGEACFRKRGATFCRWTRGCTGDTSTAHPITRVRKLRPDSSCLCLTRLEPHTTTALKSKAFPLFRRSIRVAGRQAAVKRGDFKRAAQLQEGVDKCVALSARARRVLLKGERRLSLQMAS